MRREEGMAYRTGKRRRNTTMCHNMTVTVRGGRGEWVILGMNRWGGRREWCSGQEREGKTLQHVTT